MPVSIRGIHRSMHGKSSDEIASRLYNIAQFSRLFAMGTHVAMKLARVRIEQ